MLPPAPSDPTNPPPTNPPPEPRRRTGLVVVAIVVPVVLAIGLLAGAGYLVFGRHGSGGSGSSVPAGWPTAGFVVAGTGAAGVHVRQEVGELLVARAGQGARYQVKPHGVLVAARSSSTLDRLRALVPLRTDVAFRPVVATGDQPSGPPGPVPSGTPPATAPATPASPTGPPPVDTASPSGPAASPLPSPTGPPASAPPSPSDAAGAGEQVPSLDGKTSYRLGPVAMTGTAVRSASAAVSRNGTGWQVTVTLDAAGTRQFAELTARMVDQRLAIVVAGRVVSAPTIEAAIPGGQVQVSGGFGRAAAQGLAAAFQLGRQPVTVTLGDPK